MATDNVARGLAAHALSVAVAGGGDHPVESVNGKTGNINDAIQTEGDYIVFNCGSSNTVI